MYAFEGIGIVIPIYEIAEDKEGFLRIVYFVFITVCSLYVVFGLMCVEAFGPELSLPLITSVALPENIIGWTVQILFMGNLVFTYPLQLYPAHIIVENYLYSKWPKTKKRQFTKNLSRTCLVAISIVFTLLLE